MRWVLLATALMVAVSFSGCTQAEDEPTSTTTSSSSATSSSTRTTTSRTSSSSGAPSANGTGQAPVASLSYTPENGTLNVTFLANGTDADGGNLTWTLDFGDNATANGTALPANVTHAYAAAGNYTAVLTVSDGTRNATANVTVSLSAPAAAGEDPASLCPTDTDAVAIPGAGLYATPMDTLDSPGALWIYEESNGMPGLQRNDETRPTSCPTPDTIIF